MNSMKKLISLLAAAMLLIGCQVINEADRLIPVENQAPKSRALITEFTGFLCVNCPNAAAMAHDLLGTYPENLVVVEMHPKANSFCQTTIAEYDYTCPAADTIYKALGGTAATSFPIGVINMTGGLQDYTAWPALVSASLMKEKEGRLQLTRHMTNKPRTIVVSYHADAFSSNDSRTGQKLELRLMLLLVEDNIVGPQMMPDGSTNMNYTHNHVLRGSLFDDVWGVPETVLVNQRYDDVWKIVEYQVPEMINGQTIDFMNCSVVGILMDAATREVHDVVLLKHY